MADHSDRYPNEGGATPRTLQMALALAGAGYLVFPCLPNRKEPATEHGFKDATTEPTAITGWFAERPSLNLAIATGPQPNGVNLFAVDIDAKSGGLATWAALTDVHGHPLAPKHFTPNGGFHVFFDAPSGLANTRARLGPGIDTRGVGGYVVAPPSQLVDGNGEILPLYRSTKTQALLYNPPPGLPLWIIEALEPAGPSVRIEDSVQRHPSHHETVDIYSWTKSNVSLLDLMIADGWTVGRRRGNEYQLTRPGKDVREGNSATYHRDTNHVVIYSTNAPAELRVSRPGQVTQGGHLSFSCADYLAMTRYGGDQVAMQRAMMRAAGWAGPGGEETDSGRIAPPSSDGTPPPQAPVLTLPTEFYDQRPWMAACRQMAQAVGGSPAAHLLAFMCRWATLIPPGFSIPPINGAPSSFDLLCVIAGTSGSGKTSPMRNAEEMLPILRKDLRMGLGIGSGEGIIEAFYAFEMVEGDDGKKRKERRKAIAGVNFAVSEGLIFAELAGRGGTTHVTRLCDAWSGAALSTANATAETFRHIPANQYRLSLMMGIQATQAHELMTDSAASQGFVGRLLFAWAEEPRVSPRPVPPERLVVPVPGGPPPIAGVYQQTYLSYPPEIYAEIQAANDARVGTDVPVEEHHHDLLRCKVAGILALMDGRLSVNLDDWLIATTLVDISALTRLHLYSIRRQAQRAQRHTAAVAKAESEIVVEDVKERRAIARMAEAIRNHVVDGAVSRRKVARAVSSSSTRYRFDNALTLAISNGWVVVDGDQVRSIE